MHNRAIEKHYRPAIVTLVAAGALWAALIYIGPDAIPFLPSCPLHALTGIYCPGCGATRALCELARGNLQAALRLNALAVCAIPFACARALMRKPIRLPNWGWRLLVSGIAVFGVLRNIPLFPLSLLAPG